MPTVLRFDRFEFFLHSGELITDGSRVRLEPQPAKVLAVLACRPGEVVSREELQKEIWPADTFVDFERGLNYCVRRIRIALDDSASAPRFIETLPKRGYRFLAAVDGLCSPELEPPPPGQAVEPAPSGAAPLAKDGRRAVLRLALSVAALILAGAAVVLSTRSSTVPTVAVTLFDNETDHRDLDRVAQVFTDALVERLARDSTRWSVIGNAAILRTPRPLLNLETIASSLHADFIVLGQIQPSERGLTVLTHLIRARDQRHLWVGRFASPAVVDQGLASRIAETVAAAATQRIGSGR
ncbi:MAG TPA: winged helix-turn-helix domain-containing protein [Thermoanaerobaculia bacterium]|nr:winged helix-turn-helix domain-containing protein [Thermoanaerobaculia bacterium]